MANVQRSARAGAAAVALGLSLVWPSVAIASADSPDQGSSSTSAGPAKPSGTARSARTPKPSHDSAASSSAKTPSAAAGAARKPASAARIRPITPSATPAGKPKAQSSRTVSGAATPEPATETSAVTQTADTQQSASSPVDTTPAAVTTTANVTALRIPTASATAGLAIDDFTGLLNSLQGLFDGAALLVRRSFFNEAPKLAPLVATIETSEPITGDVGAVDPEGDRLVYKVTRQAQYGYVEVNPDGTYTYTPNDDFRGVDSFVVSATDVGPHINLLNWFRTPSSYAAGAIYQEGAPRITYTFTYGSGSQFWSSAARAELAATAIYLSSYFEPADDVNITYKVTGQYSLMGGTLASAGSDLIGEGDGFFPTVVQHKIITGIDSNGDLPDGTIDWNFGYGWGYNTVTGGQYDFRSTALHELLHTYGFLSVVDRAGNNSVPTWTEFDRHIVTSTGTPVFDGNTFKTAYNSNLTGGGGGLYFGGENAKAANGGNPVKLYTPNPWESGSSMSHLDDYTFTGVLEKLMNATSDTGLGIRTLSPIEIGIMKDLGYTMVSQSTGVAVLVISLMFIRRRKRPVGA